MVIGIKRWLADKRNKVINPAGKDLGVHVWPSLFHIGVRDVFIDLGRVNMFTTDTIGIILPDDCEMLKNLLIYLIGCHVHALLDKTGNDDILWLTFY